MNVLYDLRKKGRFKTLKTKKNPAAEIRFYKDLSLSFKEVEGIKDTIKSY